MENSLYYCEDHLELFVCHHIDPVSTIITLPYKLPRPSAFLLTCPEMIKLCFFMIGKCGETRYSFAVKQN